MLLIGCHREVLYHKNLKWLNLRKSPSALFLPASSNVLDMHRYFIIRLNWILTQTRENPPQNFKDWAARLENTAVFHKSFFWNAHSVLREARKRGDWICISMNPCFLASNTFAFSCSSPCLPLSHGPLPLLALPSIHHLLFSALSPQLALALIFSSLSNWSILSCMSPESPGPMDV